MCQCVEFDQRNKVAQLCPTLCDPMDYTVHGILQARILEWVAFPFSRGSSQPKNRTVINAIDINSVSLAKENVFLVFLQFLILSVDSQNPVLNW